MKFHVSILPQARHAIRILEVYSGKTRKIPDEVMERCSKRLKQYDEVIKAAKKQTGK